MPVCLRIRAAFALLILAVVLVTTPGAKKALAEPNSLTIAVVRAEVARQLAREKGIRSVALDPNDKSVIQVQVDKADVKSIAIDVTNMFERLKRNPTQRSARIREFVRWVDWHLRDL